MSLRQGRVLLVGCAFDQPAVSLAADGFEIERATDVPQGISLAHAWDPSVILLDVSQGLDALKEFKSDELTRTVPLLLHSPQPLDDDQVVAALDAGANDVVAQPCSTAILGARVATQVSFYRFQVELREKVMRDELTGVFSRRYLFESMRQHVNQFSRPGPPVLCCLMIDVDHFKLVNDRLGHIEGDRILRQVAKFIFGMTRKGDVVARFGGEEFVVVLPSTDPEGARLVADKLRKGVQKHCGVTISIGVSWYETPASIEHKGLFSDEEMMHLLLSRADSALYQAKRDGRNRVCLQADYAGAERRRIARVEAAFPIVLNGSERSSMVSAGGLSLHDSRPLTVGDSIAVSILLSSGPVQALGRVVWTYTVRGLEERCGVAFESLEGDGQERLTQELGHRTRVIHPRGHEPI
ncbi:diguanylate cyclase [bacterium]|nr:diguanylate cyclase [bacterium]